MTSSPGASPVVVGSEKTGRAISVQQPWAWLIVNGHKHVENRDWPTRIRGVVGIHAGKKFDHEGYEWVRERFPGIRMPSPDAFPMGGIVGRATITGCVEAMDTPWFFGRYGFVLADAEPLPLMACRGQLGFFTPALLAVGPT